MTDPVELVLSRLHGVIDRHNSAWMARCPAHDDRSPSLSVSRADDGRVLIYCNVGCTGDEIIGALGLSWNDLYPDTWEAAKARALQPVKLRVDPLEVERYVLRIAAARAQRGEALNLEDEARVEVAKLRVQASLRK